MNKANTEALAKIVVDSAFKVHQTLGPGLLESAYKHCLAHELTQRGIIRDIERPLPLMYENTKLNCGYRLDIVVANTIILEIKVVDALAPIHQAQLITYLKLSGIKLGFLIDFNVVKFKEGIKRFVYNY